MYNLTCSTRHLEREINSGHKNWTVVLLAAFDRLP